MIKGNKKDRSFVVYIHKSPSGKAYVGITCQKLKDRWGENGHRYLKSAGGKIIHGLFAKAIERYGWENFQHIVFTKKVSEERAKNLEMALIHHYKSLGLSYNLTDGGEGSVGRVMSDETREKIRQGHLGVPLSEEHKRSIGLAGVGRKHSEEWIQMMREINSRPKSEEHKRKTSEALRGKPGTRRDMVNSPETRKKISESKKAQHRHHSEESKSHLSQLFKGRRDSPETKRRKSEAKKLYWLNKKMKENNDKKNQKTIWV